MNKHESHEKISAPRQMDGGTPSGLKATSPKYSTIIWLIEKKF